jgi:hypothetical protein
MYMYIHIYYDTHTVVVVVWIFIGTQKRLVVLHSTRVVRSVVPTNNLINDTIRKGEKTPRVRELSRDIEALL